MNETPTQPVRAGYFELTFEEEPELGLEELRGIGPKTAEKLADREIADQAELLMFVPRKYRRIARHLPGPEVAARRSSYVELVGKVTGKQEPARHSRRPFEVHVTVDGELFKLLWFNMPFGGFARRFQPGKWVAFEGEVDWQGGTGSLSHPDTDITKTKPSTRQPEVELEPVYTSMEGVADSRVRGAIEQAAEALLPRAVDVVPARLRRQHDLPTVAEALRTIHLLRPVDDPEGFGDEVTRARARLVYEEFYTLQRKLAEEYVAERRAASAPQCEARDLGRAIVRELPFELTDDQKAASKTLAEDLGRRMPMRRLLQGDVGSGKTVVAFLAAAICIESGQQVAMMAPTDILAQQHLRTAEELFAETDVELELVSGSLGAADRRKAFERVADGEVDFAIGTHALFQEDVEFDRLGFVIVDEQHKFGVDQRADLLGKGEDPHLLAMTATPIPRSLAHSVFGDLDLTLIREKPPGRKPVRTFLRDRTAANDVYRYLRDRIDETGEQAYLVYPMIESNPEVANRRSALESAEHLANGPMSDLNLAVLHGQMGDETKNRTMQRFADGEIDALCATTVVEVGMDVSNATVMVIESPEVFGLSQLHQLRGRVGRGSSDSICVLLAGYGLTPDARERLTSFADSNDGFVLAEKDLEIRGPGQFLGRRQSGRAEFRFGDLLRDQQLLEEARRDARGEVLGDAGA
jgi:ATP-dependent DNA helicase RecG